MLYIVRIQVLIIFTMYQMQNYQFMYTVYILLKYSIRQVYRTPVMSSQRLYCTDLGLVTKTLLSSNFVRIRMFISLVYNATAKLEKRVQHTSISSQHSKHDTIAFLEYAMQTLYLIHKYFIALPELLLKWYRYCTASTSQFKFITCLSNQCVQAILHIYE